MNERAIDFLKDQGMEVETSDASEVLGVYSGPVTKIVGHKVFSFDRAELQHVVTAKGHKDGLR
jgi:hypothetical protein